MRPLRTNATRPSPRLGRWDGRVLLPPFGDDTSGESRMKRLALVSVLLAAAATGHRPEGFWPIAEGREPMLVKEEPAPRTHQVRLNGHTFTLPAGFEIELAAKSPLVDRPIVADFDEQGRLYLADSSGSNEKVQDQLQKKPHRIGRLESSKADGR